MTEQRQEAAAGSGGREAFTVTACVEFSVRLCVCDRRFLSSCSDLCSPREALLHMDRVRIQPPESSCEHV